MQRNDPDWSTATTDADQTRVRMMVFAIAGERIAGITGFPRQPDLFTRLGLPIKLAADDRY